ncbi:MAG: helix-turn-helix domain-containing protein [Clostridia bacterium]|nr:helix-turn-helix domain-containing protein [Clostridia bacterium]
MAGILDQKVDLAFLAAFYGRLLTGNQRQILSLYCEEDFSLGEIAAEMGVSRQAAHETLSRAASKLEEMEAALGVARRFRRTQAGLEEALSALEGGQYERVRKVLKDLLSLDQEDTDGL